MVWPGGHGMVYGMAWRACMIYDMAVWAWHGIWLSLAGIAFGIRYWLEDMELAGMAWYMTWSGGHNMVYGMAWRA